jgi:hypothetical protein
LPYFTGALAAACLLLAAMAAGPLRGGLMAARPAAQCEPPEKALTLRYNAGSALRVVEGAVDWRILPTTIRRADLVARVESTPPGSLDHLTRAVARSADAGPLPVTIALAPDLSRGNLAMVVFHRVEPPPDGRIMAVCANWDDGRYIVARIVAVAARQ